MLDVDFSFCCGDVARTLDRYARAVRADTELSYVLPAFEVAEGEVIRSKGELLDRLDRSGAGVFEKQAQITQDYLTVTRDDLSSPEFTRVHPSSPEFTRVQPSSLELTRVH